MVLIAKTTGISKLSQVGAGQLVAGIPLMIKFYPLPEPTLYLYCMVHFSKGNASLVITLCSHHFLAL